MSESSTRSGDWLTVSQAAKALGISERQARRDAGRLAGHDRQEAGHEAGHVATLVRLSAMQDLRTKKAPREVEPDNTPDMRPDTLATEAGHEAGHIHATPDNDNARLLAERECGFLRDALQRERQNADQWRAQVEAANRQAAEATAALREYLKLQAKALPSPDKLQQVATDNSAANARALSSQNARQGAQNVGTGKVSAEAKTGARGEGLRELRAILRKLWGRQ